MEVERDKMTVSVSYRGKPYTAELPHDATVGELGVQLSHLTGAALHTVRLLLPRGRQGPFLSLLPASEQHSFVTLKSAGISTGIVLRMMGATSEEVKEVSQPGNKCVDGRVIGFEEEERREKLRSGVGTRIQLPKGPYSFSDFRTLALPGIELNPPPHKALAIMHKLASDPGIVAIMNKHRWQVGVMTELTPVGFVGISPKCLLGFNKNRGQEISLRLRTDDLRGFRKYESIKKTLLHELAHMVHDEHDEHFHALDKQLNQEAIALDWTKSGGHTLNESRFIEDDDSPMDVGGVSSGHKLGGRSIPSSNIRRTAAQAAIMRLEQSKHTPEPSKADPFASTQKSVLSEPDPDESMVHSTTLPSCSSAERSNEPDPDEIARDIVVIAEGQATGKEFDNQNARMGPDPDDALQHSEEPDPDENAISPLVHAILPVMDTRSREPGQDNSRAEPDPDNSLSIDHKHTSSRGFHEPDPDDMLVKEKTAVEPDPDARMEMTGEPDPDERLEMIGEPDPDELMEMTGEPDPDEHMEMTGEPDPDERLEMTGELDPDERIELGGEPNPDEHMKVAGDPGPDKPMVLKEEPDPDASAAESCRVEPDPDENARDLDLGIVDGEIARIQESTATAMARLQNAITTLRRQASPAETTAAIQVLFTIFRNVIDHPNEDKYRRLRKGNPTFHNRVAKFTGAVEFLQAVGFTDGESPIGSGGVDCLVLKRSDPGLLWLARSMLESSLA